MRKALKELTNKAFTSHAHSSSRKLSHHSLTLSSTRTHAHRRLNSCQPRVQYSRCYRKSQQDRKKSIIPFTYRRLLASSAHVLDNVCMLTVPRTPPYIHSLLTCTHMPSPPLSLCLSYTHIQLPYNLGSHSLSRTHINTQKSK